MTPLEQAPQKLSRAPGSPGPWEVMGEHPSEVGRGQQLADPCRMLGQPDALSPACPR